MTTRQKKRGDRQIGDELAGGVISLCVLRVSVAKSNYLRIVADAICNKAGVRPKAVSSDAV
jgi:hypothetical protein